MADNVTAGEQELRKFCSNYPLRYFKKDRPLFYQGEVPQTAFFIKSGVVKVYNITSSGEEKIVSYEASGGVVPTSWIFGKTPAAMFYYDSFTDCQLYTIPKKNLLEFINSHHASTVSLLQRYTSMYTSATMHLHALEQSKARDKLLHIFQYLVLRFGKQHTNSIYKIELRLTHQDIANLVGLTRETVSTELSKLTKMEVVLSKKLHFFVDTDKALRQLGEDDFNEVSL